MIVPMFGLTRILMNLIVFTVGTVMVLMVVTVVVLGTVGLLTCVLHHYNQQYNPAVSCLSATPGPHHRLSTPPPPLPSPPTKKKIPTTTATTTVVIATSLPPSPPSTSITDISQNSSCRSCTTSSSRTAVSDDDAPPPPPPPPHHHQHHHYYDDRNPLFVPAAPNRETARVCVLLRTRRAPAHVRLLFCCCYCWRRRRRRRRRRTNAVVAATSRGRDVGNAAPSRAVEFKCIDYGIGSCGQRAVLCTARVCTKRVRAARATFAAVPSLKWVVPDSQRVPPDPGLLCCTRTITTARAYNIYSARDLFSIGYFPPRPDTL